MLVLVGLSIVFSFTTNNVVMKLTDKDFGFTLVDYKGIPVFSKCNHGGQTRRYGPTEYDFVIITSAPKDVAFEYATKVLRPAELATERRDPGAAYVIKFEDLTDLITPFSDNVESGEFLYQYIVREDYND